jgi:hypothetical protein
MRIWRLSILVAIGFVAQRSFADCNWTGTTSQTTTCTVGIGVAAPGELLHVNGNQAAVRIEDTGSTRSTLRFFTSGIERVSVEGGNDGALRIKTRDGGAALSEKLAILGNGNVGIGWTNPGYKFVVIGRIYSAAEQDADGWGNFRAEYSDSPGSAASPGVSSYRMTYFNIPMAAVGFMPYDTANGALRLFTRSSGTLTRRMTIEPGGRVGIGVDNPIASLQTFGSLVVGGEAGSAGSNRLVLGASHGDYGMIGYNTMPTGAPSQYVPASDQDYASQIKFEAGGLKFRTTTAFPAMSQSIPFVEAMTIARNGDVNVAGSIHANGSITGATVIGAAYQDVAEWVEATENLSAGTVVVLSRSRSNEVTASSTSYDTRVAGVVSAQPGVLLGVGGTSKEMIATTGRVRVLVDATQRPIEIGDLLVTSESTGRAMKSVPVAIGDVEVHRPGTIIGKALEPLAGGIGEILVLLSLQ